MHTRPRRKRPRRPRPRRDRKGGRGGAKAGAGIADISGGGGDKVRGRPVAMGLTPLPLTLLQKRK